MFVFMRFRTAHAMEGKMVWVNPMPLIAAWTFTR
jgi:hypothetical protein